MGDSAVTASPNTEPDTQVTQYSDTLDTVGGAGQEDADNEGRRPRHRWWQTTLLAVFSGGMLGGLLHARYGYSSGTIDHEVLSPLGLHWADPGYFGNDWFIREAPQPHWFFDVVTWLGASLGQLSAVYFLYWVSSLIVFGFATAILARRWAPSHPWVASILVTLFAGITPWWLLGTGSPLWPQALPVVLAGSLLYLSVAALLTDRRVLAVVATVLTAIVHVQQGLVVAVILVALAVVHLVRTRKVDWLYLAGGVVAGGIVLGALAARPVVGNLDDFAQVCSQIIPYHCEASSWPTSQVIAGLALVALAMLTVLFGEKGDRIVWCTVLALPAFGLVSGILVDRFNVPFLGVLAQGVNVYRLDVTMLAAGCWGVLVPVFVKVRPWARVVLGLVVVGLGWLVLGTRRYEIKLAVPEHGGWWMLVFVAGLAIAVVAVLVRRYEGLGIRVGGLVMVAGIGAAILAQGGLKARMIDATFIPDDSIREWGAEVHEVVPAGGVLLAPPLATYVRLSTGHAVVADCKNVPYGGAAWQHYEQRLNTMGGVRQCSLKSPGIFNELPATSIEAAAREWGADYVVVEEGQAWRTPDLLERGWTVVLRPQGPLKNSILKAPWA